MLDFTASLYLGFHHSSQEIGSWRQLTRGRPAALSEPAFQQALALQFAALQGLEAGVFAPSTLHLFWDVLGLLGQSSFVAFVDADTYPIVKWGVERFQHLGNSVFTFRSHQPQHLDQLLKTQLKPAQKPLIVTDGWDVEKGQLAPLKAYLKAARAYGGLLMVDDTQALGLLGSRPTAPQPYGKGGGGSLKYLGISGSDIILVASLAKGWGVPMAVMSSSRGMINRWRSHSQTRLHCSPPSQVDILAAAHALKLNRQQGDRRRHQLFQIVRYFKKSLGAIGIPTHGGIFPVQTLILPRSINASCLQASLRKSGIRTLLVENPFDSQLAGLSFVLNVEHSKTAIDYAVNGIRKVLTSRLSLTPNFECKNGRSPQLQH